MNYAYITYSTGNVGPADARSMPRFSRISTFARLPRLEEVTRADIAIVGAPFGSSFSVRARARLTPQRVRESSRTLRSFNSQSNVAPFVEAQIVDAGDIAFDSEDITAVQQQVQTAAEHLRRGGMRLVMIGSDRAIGLPNLRSLHADHGPVAVVRFDAHLDEREMRSRAAVAHPSPFPQAADEDLIDELRGVHVGARGPLYGSEDVRDDDRRGFATISTEDLAVDGAAVSIERMLARIGKAPVYVSVDMDVLAGSKPSDADEGATTAGGMTVRGLQAMIAALGSANIVGAEVIDSSDAQPGSEADDTTAAQVAYDLISAMVVGRRSR